MSSNLIAYLIAALSLIISVPIMFGLPALAIVIVKYFKLKERETALELEYRQKSQQQELAIEQRVRARERYSRFMHLRSCAKRGSERMPS
jgi:hypothetical protein